MARRDAGGVDATGAWDRRRFLRAASIAGLAGAAALAAGCARPDDARTHPSSSTAAPPIPRDAPRAPASAWSPQGDGNAWTPLIDDALWPALVAAIEGARSRIDLSQLYFEPTFAPLGEPLADLLVEAADRGVDVRVLMDRGIFLQDDADGTRARFSGTDVAVRARPYWPNVLHAKMVAVDDGDAFLVDPPFEARYLATDQRAVSVRVAGAPARLVGTLFDALWDADPLAAPAPAARAPPAGGGIGIAWSAPPGTLDARPCEGISEAYLAAIGRARHRIDIETQYFTSPRIAAALRDALAREPDLQVHLRLNRHTDIVTYDQRQALRLAELGHPDEPRLHVTYDEGYVHSKVAIVDDAWATIGSANLDAVSLHETHAELHPRWPNLDVNALMQEGAPGGQVGAFRRALQGARVGQHERAAP